MTGGRFVDAKGRTVRPGEYWGRPAWMAPDPVAPDDPNEDYPRTSEPYTAPFYELNHARRGGDYTVSGAPGKFPLVKDNWFEEDGTYGFATECEIAFEVDA